MILFMSKNVQEKVNLFKEGDIIVENSFKIIKELQQTSKSKEKENILKQNINNELLKNILYFSFNNFLVTGISSKKLKKKVKSNGYHITHLDVLMEYLQKNNTGRDIDIATVQGYLFLLTENEKEIVSQIVTKSLKIGCTAKTLNKVYGEGFIPEFNVQLAESYFKQKEGYLKGREFILTQKLDGTRLAIIKENGNVKCFSRQGQPVEGLIEILEDMKDFPDNIVLDGELIAENPDNLPSDELFRLTMKIARKDGDKKGLIFNCFDLVSLKDFKSGISEEGCISRKEKLSKLFKEINPKHIIEVPMLYVGNDESKIMEWLTWAKNNNMEGIMVNLANAPYECKRTKGILKVKVMQTCDLKIIGYEEGQGRNKGKLGAFIVDYKGYNLKVGGGYSDSQREEFWIDRDKLIGRVIEVQYFEESQSQEGNISLRFPVFKELREVGKEISYD